MFRPTPCGRDTYAARKASGGYPVVREPCEKRIPTNSRLVSKRIYNAAMREGKLVSQTEIVGRGSKPIRLPEKLTGPDTVFLRFHREEIFQR
jgi:hypothetical protein